jgi:anti-sigma factor RsiW
MKHDLQLKVQAWVDGELPQPEAGRVGQWIARDAEASALAAELGCIRQAMLRNEAPATPGESHEFSWSKIERQIQREAGLRRSDETPWYARWRRYIVPLAGVAALAAVLVTGVRQARAPAFDEISSTIDGMEAVTFHDQSSQMTVVWLEDNAPATAEDQSAPKPIRFQSEPESVVDM